MKNFIVLCSVSDMTFDSEPLEWIEEFPEKKTPDLISPLT